MRKIFVYLFEMMNQKNRRKFLSNVDCFFLFLKLNVDDDNGWQKTQEKNR